MADEVQCRQVYMMHMGRGNLGGSYVMNGGTLGEVSEERDLGVRITSDMKASAHCAFVCSRANRVVCRY